MFAIKCLVKMYIEKVIFYLFGTKTFSYLNKDKRRGERLIVASRLTIEDIFQRLICLSVIKTIQIKVLSDDSTTCFEVFVRIKSFLFRVVRQQTHTYFRNLIRNYKTFGKKQNKPTDTHTLFEILSYFWNMAALSSRSNSLFFRWSVMNF